MNFHESKGHYSLWSRFFVAKKSVLLVVGHMDLDYAGDLDDKRSSTGYVFTLGGPICWKSTIHFMVILSTMETEYMSIVEAIKEV